MGARRTRLAALGLAAVAAAAAHADAASMQATIAGINAGTTPADFTLKNFAAMAANSQQVTAALTGPTNSVTLFAFTDEGWDNMFNSSFDYKAYYDFDIKDKATQGGVINNHLLKGAINVTPLDENATVVDPVTYPTALTSSDASKLTTLPAQVIQPNYDGTGINSGLLYSEVVQSIATDQGPLHVVRSVLMPFPNADKTMQSSNDSTGEGGYQLASFAKSLKDAGISTDSYSKVTVLAVDDETWDGFKTMYASKFSADQFKQILQYHIIPTETVYLFEQGVKFSQTHKTLQGENIEITRFGAGEINVGNPGAVTEAGGASDRVGAAASFAYGNDMGVKNGVIQLLSNPLIPPALQNVLPVPTGVTGATETYTGTFAPETVTFTGTFMPETITPTMSGSGALATTTAPVTTSTSRPASAGRTVAGLAVAGLGAVAGFFALLL